MGLISKIKEGLMHDSSSERASLNSGADIEISSPVAAPAQDAIDVVHEQSADAAIETAERAKVVVDEEAASKTASKEAYASKDASNEVSKEAYAAKDSYKESSKDVSKEAYTSEEFSASSASATKEVSASQASLTEVAVTDAQSEAVAEAARRAAAEAQVEADVTVIDRGVEDVQVREREAIVQETQNLHEKLEVQPVVQKEIEETEIRQIVQPVLDVQRERSEEQRVLETENREVVEEISAEEKARYEQQASAYEDKRERGETSAETVVHGAKIQEVHKKHIIHEIQPVIQRDIIHTHVIKTVQPIHEHIVTGAKVEELKINAPMTMEEFRAKTSASAAAVSTSETSAVSSSAHAASSSAAYAEKSSSASAHAIRAEPVAVAVEQVQVREP